MEIIELTYKRPVRGAYRIETDTVKAQCRKAKAVWTMEAAQDLASWHNIRTQWEDK
jgi:major capsid protein Gp23